MLNRRVYLASFGRFEVPRDSARRPRAATVLYTVQYEAGSAKNCDKLALRSILIFRNVRTYDVSDTGIWKIERICAYDRDFRVVAVPFILYLVRFCSSKSCKYTGISAAAGVR